MLKSSEISLLIPAIKMRAGKARQQPVKMSKSKQLEIAKEEAFREGGDGNDPAAFTFKPH
ncbi:hypothetical protein [Paenibacillus larvae]|uniref:hypothetical protein n=1 Tax=Paenibacillus larvae TaxID=1464 RepID=UPI00288CEB89|nr:hypothetical protein [Paenibacillus larvae]MDT2191038.1 hypothetical protein [Paenibacillus larvae]